MIRMAMRDQRALDRPHRIDVKTADRAAQPGGRRPQDVFRTHGLQICHIGRIANRGRVAAFHHLRRPDRRPPLRIGARLRGRGRPRGCGRLVCAGDGTCARFRLRVVRARRSARSAGRPRGRARRVRAGARPPTPRTAMARRCTLRGSAPPTRRRRRCTATCARCSTSTRRASIAHSRTSPIRRRSCCARR